MYSTLDTCPNYNKRIHAHAIYNIQCTWCVTPDIIQHKLPQVQSRVNPTERSRSVFILHTNIKSFPSQLVLVYIPNIKLMYYTDIQQNTFHTRVF